MEASTGSLKSYSGYLYLATDEKRELQTIIKRAALAAREKERQIAQQVAQQLAQEYATKEKALKRKADEALEDLRAKEEVMSYLNPPKCAKNDYMERKPAKYVFKCMDGDIQIPAYGLRTDFYIKERISYL